MIVFIKTIGILLFLYGGYNTYLYHDTDTHIISYLGYFIIAFTCFFIPLNSKLSLIGFVGFITTIIGTYIMLTGLGYDFEKKIETAPNLVSIFSGASLYYIGSKFLGIQFDWIHMGTGDDD